MPELLIVALVALDEDQTPPDGPDMLIVPPAHKAEGPVIESG
jgi:hypothetical protein